MDLVKVLEIRNRILRGEDVPPEELAEAIEFLRQGRRSASKEEKPKVDLDQLKKELGL